MFTLIISLSLVIMISSIYLWTFYNLPILFIGFKQLFKTKGRKKDEKYNESELPFFSIIIPAKNEEKVISRLLIALSKIKYPENKKEVIIVEDGSNDKTNEICTLFSKKNKIKNFKILTKKESKGKPSALNYGIKHAKGKIIGIFDADNVPEPEILYKVIKYFKKPKVAAVQGRTFTINSEENLITKIISYEEAVYCEGYLAGKNALNLFVPLKGSCQFITKESLDNIQGFDDNSLSEDLEISAKLTEKGYEIKYSQEACSWQESPANLKQLIKQRTRWHRGTIETALKYGKLIAKPSKINVDAEITLLAPFVLIASLCTYIISFFSFNNAFSSEVIWKIVMQFTAITSTLTLIIFGLVLIYASKPRKMKNVFWLPFLYFYWSLQTIIALYAMLLILFRRPRKWLKTEKTGIIKKSTSS